MQWSITHKYLDTLSCLQPYLAAMTQVGSSSAVIGGATSFLGVMFAVLGEAGQWQVK